MSWADDKIRIRKNQKKLVEYKKTIKCMGHCWEWDLETGKGINTSKDLQIKCGVLN